MKRYRFLFFVLFVAVCAAYSQTTDSVQFKVTTLNAEWLSCADSGPSDDNLQINNIATLIKLLNSDVVALQEVEINSKSGDWEHFR